MIDFSQYLIASDLDGTFLNSRQMPPARNLQALEHFKRGGGRFAFATGRLRINITHCLPHPEQLCNAPAVFCNGGYLYDFETHAVSDVSLFTEADVHALLQFLEQEIPDVLYRVSGIDNIRAIAPVGPIKEDITGYDEGTVLLSPPETWQKDDWLKVVLRAEPRRLSEARRALVARFGNRFALAASAPDFLEIMPQGCSKAEGIAKLRHWLRQKGEHRTVIACGDFENDLLMLREADISVCPSNALALVQKEADYTLGSCETGFFADLVEHLERGLLPRKRSAL